MTILLYSAQIVIALGLLNVWLLRSGRATRYRGGNATTMQEEFQVYGLSRPVMLAVGTIKVAMALLLLAGMYYPQLGRIGAAVIAPLMLVAVLMHFKVRDPISRALPAAAVLLLAVFVLSAGS